MKQEAPRQRRSRTGIPAIHGGEHVKQALGYWCGSYGTRR
jgi:hypothetical protein